MNKLNKFGEMDFVEKLKQDFQLAKPYKHVAIDNFLEEEFAEQLAVNFPSADQLSRHYNGLNENKSEGADLEKFHPSFQVFRDLLSSDEFYRKLSYITGVDKLFSTTDALGYGVHQGKNGSFLDIHIDFNIHYKENFWRRVNLLVFLNKDWQESFGGALELWNSDVSKLEQSFLPVFNRCVIFECNDISYHGYSRISVPEGVTRNSIYSYFYTTLDDSQQKYHDTVFKARPEEGAVKKIKTDIKELVKNTGKSVLRKLSGNGK